MIKSVIKIRSFRVLNLPMTHKIRRPRVQSRCAEAGHGGDAGVGHFQYLHSRTYWGTGRAAIIVPGPRNRSVEMRTARIASRQGPRHNYLPTCLPPAMAAILEAHRYARPLRRTLHRRAPPDKQGLLYNSLAKFLAKFYGKEIQENM